MKNRKLLKIGLSLLIALSFILPGANILADNSPEAGNEQSISPNEGFRALDPIRLPSDITSQDGRDIHGAALQAPDGEIINPCGKTILNEDWYQPGLLLTGEDNQGALEIFKTWELWEYPDSAWETLYSTSFEDNYDIYNNWEQIDKDCGSDDSSGEGPDHGFDMFTWTDARASDGDHSFKNSMYDIYKGNQDDYLKCLKEFDLDEDDDGWADYAYIKVNFDIWVEGEAVFDTEGYENYYGYAPTDYLSFEVGDCSDLFWINPDNYFNGLAQDEITHVEGGEVYVDQRADLMLFQGQGASPYQVEGQDTVGGAYYFFDTSIPLFDDDPYKDYTPKVTDKGGGWWEVSWNIDPMDLVFYGGLSLENIMFRFDWHSDPEFQFEGAYVDNFNVEVLPESEEKVYQGFYQTPQDVHCEYPKFVPMPMKWSPVDNGKYTMKWGVNSETLTESCQFEVNDEYDGMITDIQVDDSFTGDVISDGGILEPGHDAHIQFEYCQGGSIPGENIPITASAHEVNWEEDFSDDFEGMFGWEAGAWEGPNQVHTSDFDAWSGSKSLAIFDKDSKHYENDVYNYVLAPETVNIEDPAYKGNSPWGKQPYDDVELDFYSRLSLDQGDQFGFFLFDGQYILRIIMSGSSPEYNPEWVGPENPCCNYQPIDLDYWWNFWHNYAGYQFFTNPDGTPNFDVGFGFWFDSDGQGYTNHRAEANDDYWSGVLIDDVSVTVKKTGDEIWSDTIVLPGGPCGGPIEPGECMTFEQSPQFEWEDVPHSCYQIIVEAPYEYNTIVDTIPLNNAESMNLCVISDLEKATAKKVEPEDLTGVGGGEWEISSSDADNYLASNHVSNVYPRDANYVVNLVPTETYDMSEDDLLNNEDGVYVNEDIVTSTKDCEACENAINITHLWDDCHWVTDQITILEEDFSGGLPSGWTATTGWDFNLGYARLYWLYAGSLDEMVTAPIDTSGSVGDVLFTFDSDIDHYANAFTCKVLGRASSSDPWTDVTPWSNPITSDIADTYTIDITAFKSTSTQLKFEWEGYYFDLNSWELDNFIILGDDTHVECGDPELSAPVYLNVSFDAWWDIEQGSDFAFLEVADGEIGDGEDKLCPGDQFTDWVKVATFTGESRFEPDADNDGWVRRTFNLGTLIDEESEYISLRFRMVSDNGVEFRGLKLDNMFIPGLISADGSYDPEICGDINFTDKMDNMNNWQNEIMKYGTAWHEDGTCFYQLNDVGGDEWVAGIPYNDALVWPTEIRDAYYAQLTYGQCEWDLAEEIITVSVPPEDVDYDVDLGAMGINLDGDHMITFEWDVPCEYILIFSDGKFQAKIEGDVGIYEFMTTEVFDASDLKVEFVNVLGAGDFTVSLSSIGYIEISGDGGDTWTTLAKLTGSGSDPYCYGNNWDLNAFIGKNILIRNRYWGDVGGWWHICDMAIAGKIDSTAPQTEAQMSGQMADGWYSTPVEITITATDEGAGMGEIHYILDGSETVVSGDKAQFTVRENGVHNLEFWGVDKTGNEETPHNTIPPFRIDSGAPPTVEITGPEPGFYLFGNKLLSMSKVFIIGAFTAEATASDAESGIYTVQFLLDGDVVSESTEAPYSAYIAQKNMGAATIKVIAEDFSGNTAEDTLDITYYKFL